MVSLLKSLRSSLVERIIGNAEADGSIPFEGSELFPPTKLTRDYIN